MSHVTAHDVCGHRARGVYNEGGCGAAWAKCGRMGIWETDSGVGVAGERVEVWCNLSGAERHEQWAGACSVACVVRLSVILACRHGLQYYK